MNVRIHFWRLLLVATLVCSTAIITPIKAVNSPTVVDRKTDANIIGHVVDANTKEHLAGITILIKNTSTGVTTDASGHYKMIDLKSGKVTLIMRGLGYVTQEKSVVIKANSTLEVNWEAREDVMSLDEVVVSSNRQKTLRRYAPTLVSVLDEKVFAQANANNLAQGLTFQPGIRMETNCQNCGFSQVRINGLDGHFSQILIDSRPLFSALAGVYGLEQIPANMIDRVEVVRGGGSALYGSSAIAGVVNIITKEPVSNSFSLREDLSFTGGTKPDNTIAFNASIVSNDSRSGAMIFGQSRERMPWDANGDGFSEIGRLSSRSFGTRAFFRINDQNKLTGEYHSISEYRRGGDRIAELPSQYAAVSERLNHSIHSANAKYEWVSSDRAHNFQLYTSGQYIKRKSYYGGIGDENVGSLGNPTPDDAVGKEFGITTNKTAVAGAQYTFNTDHFLFLPFELLVGAEYMYDDLHDIMPIRYWITSPKDPKKSLYPGVNQQIHNMSQIAQVEWKNDSWTFLAGARMDEHSMVRDAKGNFKPIISPRATLRWNPTKEVNLRATYSKGFRAPQAFDEDFHVSVVQGDALRVVTPKDGSLTPEYSHSFSLSSDMYFNAEHFQSNFLVEAFFTRLQNPFALELMPDQNDGFITQKRVNGEGATVYGINLEAKMVIFDHWSIQSGFTYTRSQWDKAQGTGAERSLLKGETEKNMKDIATFTDNGPATVDGFTKDADGNYINVEMESKEYMRTPNMYGYVTLNYNPIKPLNLSATLNYTGSMYAPHNIEFGKGIAKKDRELVAAGKRQDTASVDDVPVWGVIEKTPSFFELGLRASYDFQFFSSNTLQLYLGAKNLLNAYQNDFDITGGRDSAYIYGPSQPRTIFTGLVIKM